jgi:CubicO group peptidase (beta-lactamase class C family)
MLETTDPAELRAFAEAAIAESSADGEPREQALARLATLARQSGGVVAAKWESRGSRHFFEGVTRKGDLAVDGMVVVKDGKIVHFEMQRNLMARGAGAPAWPPAARTAADAIPLIAAEIDWRAREQRFSGAVLIAHRGRPVLERAWGLAHRSPDRPNTPETCSPPPPPPRC